MKLMQVDETNIEIKDEKAIGGEKKPTVYELGYLLVPTIKEEDVPVIYGNLKELVSSFGSEIIMDEMPKMINLAYKMQKVVSNVRSKFNTAYFGWIKFATNSAQVVELKSKLDLDPNIIRFLIIKTVRENTMATKRYGRGETYRKPKPKNKENEIVVPINKEEIDKEIDALVAA